MKSNIKNFKKQIQHLITRLRSSVIEHLSCKQRVEGLTPFAGFHYLFIFRALPTTMVWQDIVITTCIIAFSYALIPQITLGFKKKKSLISTQTSLITATGMIILGIVYITLNLTFSSILAFITGALWATILIQSLIYKK